MKKKILFFTVALLGISNAFAVVTWDGTSSTTWTQGSGTEADPFIISSPNHLAYLAQQVNAGNTYVGNYFKQTEDFNLNRKTWTSIGTTSNKFAGNYDGGEKKISNLKNRLFGYIEDASLKNLTIDGIFSGSGSMFVGNTNGVTKISNCHNKSTCTTSSDYFGCIVCEAKGTSITIENCSNQGTVNVTAGTSQSNSYLGGIIGLATAATTTLKNCYNSGDIQISRSSSNYFYSTYYVDAAGIVNGSATVDQCYNAGSVTAKGTGTDFSGVETRVYGIGGSIITRSYNVGDINSNAGGHAANSYAYALGSGEITACYVANCTINATATYNNTNSKKYFSYRSCESCYYVGNQKLDGLEGSNVYTNYWYTGTSAYKKSDEAFKAPSMIPLLNMLDEYFTMDYEGINDGYPILKWQAGTRYNISATCDADRGSVSGSGEYPNGYSATLTATPKSGCTFVGWSDGNTDNPRTVTVSGEASYIAQFTKSSYIIYVNQDCSGNIE